ncbi:hypothetical protein D3C75_1264530 [compost metagenome]
MERTDPTRTTRLVMPTRRAVQPAALSQFPINFCARYGASTRPPIASTGKYKVAPEVPLDLANAAINAPLIEPQMPKHQLWVFMNAHSRSR